MSGVPFGVSLNGKERVNRYNNTNNELDDLESDMSDMSDDNSEYNPDANSEDISEFSDDEEAFGSDLASTNEAHQERIKKFENDGITENIQESMKKEHKYPATHASNFQYTIYKKRDFHGSRIEDRNNIKTYDDVKELRENVCARNFALRSHQTLLSNFINPNTPYKGLLVFHGTGTGKCVLGDTVIYSNNCKGTIEELWNVYKTECVNDGIGDWSAPNKNIIVNCYDQSTNKMITSVVDKLYRQKVHEVMNHVILDNGLSIKMTKLHKLLKLNDDGSVEWSCGVGREKLNRTNEYKKGDRVCIPNAINNSLDYATIVEINEFEYDGYVYDLEVKTHHNYVANGLICHNTCVGISIAEEFKPMIQKYGTKIYILVSGPIIREVWKDGIIKCTGETYLKNVEKDTNEIRARKVAINSALQYYKFFSYRSFYKRVLGDKIIDKKLNEDNKKIKSQYRKNEQGDYERLVPFDRIDNLNNSIIIVDEAHGLTNNAYGQALLKIIKNSYNLRLVLMTATPMKNLGSDIVELLNFIRPLNSQIQKEKIFTNDPGHTMKFKEGGLEYLKKMCRGYVSYLRGADPLTFAKRVELGEVPKCLKFTKVTSCTMLEFQRASYDEAIKNKDDSLDRRSEAVANVVFPCLSEDKKSIIGVYGPEGIGMVKKQLKINKDLLNKKIKEFLEETLKKDGVKYDLPYDLITISDNGKTVTGNIFNKTLLKYFSVKFNRILNDIDQLYINKINPRTAFVYSNLVKAGIEIFQEVLKINGWLEYDEDFENYQITNNIKCYYCGYSFDKHVKNGNLQVAQPNSQKFNNFRIEGDKKIPVHNFSPSTFISVTGKATDEVAEALPEDKQRILRTVFSNIENREGKYIKLVLGSRVMNEGVSLDNVEWAYILDVHYNLGKVDQVIGRTIRGCSHYKTINDDNKYPEVKIYKYCVTIDGGNKELSTEEELYKKAELKHLLIKMIERAMKEVAIDCPLNRNGNIFKEDLEEYKDCNKPGHIKCPAICDYTDCNFICDDAMLNNEFYDPERNLYRAIEKSKLDYSTFTNSLAKTEIEIAKIKIKEMYKLKYVYKLEDILDYVRESYKIMKKDLFDEFFVYKALDQLIPKDNNDFNNFKDTVFDMNNVPGYLIYRHDAYIYQPSNQNENVPMYYRSTYLKELTNKLSLHNYMKNIMEYKTYKGNKKIVKKGDELVKERTNYDFETTMDYYDNRDENAIVGVIDNSTNRKDIDIDEVKDVFKIRNKRDKILEKRRGTGIPTLKGAVCNTSKDKGYLEGIANDLGEIFNKKQLDEMLRNDICDSIKLKLLELEKYNLENKTYIMIPYNHPEYPFPYNLQDRVKYIIDNIKNKIKFELKIKVDKIPIKNKKGEDDIIKIKTAKIPKFKYKIIISNTDKLNNYTDVLKSNNAKLKGNEWIIEVE
jgi:superfamily II DNA or RNA helicase